MKSTTEAELVDQGERRDRRGRRMTPAARRAELVEAWRRSGLTRAAFARREGLSYPTFAGWVQSAPYGLSDTSKVRFAEVHPSHPPTPGPLAAGLAAAASAGLDVRKRPTGDLLVEPDWRR